MGSEQEEEKEEILEDIMHFMKLVEGKDAKLYIIRDTELSDWIG